MTENTDIPGSPRPGREERPAGEFPSIFSLRPDIDGMKQRKDVGGLIRALKSRDPAIQWEATSALTEIGPAALDRLLAGLGSRNRDVRLGIIEILGEIGDPRALSPLVSLLGDETPEIRWETALALGQLGDPGAIGPLKDALRDNDRYVRFGAARALEQMGWVPGDSQESALLANGLQDWNALAAMGPAAVGSLGISAKDPDPDVRIDAMRTLGRIGDRNAASAIFRGLADADGRVRWEAVLASERAGIEPRFLPVALSRRPRTRKSPVIAGFLNLVLPGIGYFWLGKWWGVLIFQIDTYATVWILQSYDFAAALNYLIPLYLLVAIHAWYIARHMPDF